MSESILGIQVHVTKKHIAAGDKQDCKRCPVALALKDSFPTEENIDADLEKIRVGNRYFETPDKIRRFMNRFDYGSRWRLRSVKFVLQREFAGSHSYRIIRDLTEAETNG